MSRTSEHYLSSATAVLLVGLCAGCEPAARVVFVPVAAAASSGGSFAGVMVLVLVGALIVAYAQDVSIFFRVYGKWIGVSFMLVSVAAAVHAVRKEELAPVWITMAAIVATLLFQDGCHACAAFVEKPF